MRPHIISGGQSGADLAALETAKAYGFPTGGWMPKGFMTEDGPRPAYREKYGMVETSSTEYPVRTRLNARAAEVTAWFGHTGSAGYHATQRNARFFLENPTPEELLAALYLERVRVLNVAGNRRSGNANVAQEVATTLSRVLSVLKTVKSRLDAQV